MSFGVDWTCACGWGNLDVRRKCRQCGTPRRLTDSELAGKLNWVDSVEAGLDGGGQPSISNGQDLVEIIRALSTDAVRYRWLRNRDLNTIACGGVFAGMTPDNVVLNDEDLDRAIDEAMAKAEPST